MQIGSFVRRAALHFRAAPCLAENGRLLSFKEFDEVTDRVGNALLASGLRPGDRVGVLMPNGVDCIIAYYALAKAGLVRVSLNTRELEDDHRYKLNDSGSRAVIHTGAYRDLGVDITFDGERFQELIRWADRRPCCVDRPLDAPLRLGYTGGTTGRPKAVTLTTRGELSELSAFLIDLVPDIRRTDTFLHAAPIAHASGAFFLPALVRGARSVIMPKFDPAQFLEVSEREGATLTFLVPTMLAMILEVPERPDARRSLRRIVYGASPIAASVLRRAEARYGRIFSQTYGQAESPMVITCLRPEEHDRIGSCGRPFTCVEVAVMNEQNQMVPAGEVGEIVCRGPQTMAGYWNRPEATAEVFRGGWLHTGDLGRMDDEGYFYILDRKNDMLISGGYNVYPREVEEVLHSYPGITEVAVVGLPDEKWGDRVHAVVVGRADLEPERILAYAAERLAGFKRPRSVEIWLELPKTAANKIPRRMIRERILERNSRAEKSGGPS
jgi:acyl-CoA synthetase (AMP-forming)/AMP-acid ligase II